MMPYMVRKEVWLGPAGLEPPAGARIGREKKGSTTITNKKIRGWAVGIICAPRAKHRIAPKKISIMIENLIYSATLPLISLFDLKIRT